MLQSLARVTRSKASSLVRPPLLGWLGLVSAIAILVLAAVFGALQAVLVAAVVVPSVWMVLHRPQRGVLLLAGLVPFDGLLLLVQHSSSVQYWKEVFVVVILGATFFAPVEARAQVDRKFRPGWLPGLLALLLLAFVSAAFVGGSAALYGLRYGFFFCLLSLAVWRCPLDRRERDWLVSILMGAGLAEALIGIGQQAIGPTGLHNLGYQYNTAIQYSGSLLRSFGTFSAPQYLGLFLMIVSLLGATFAFAEPQRTRSRLFVFALPIYMLAMVLSVARGALLGTAVGLAYLCWRHYRPAFLIVPLIVVALFFIPAHFRGPLLASHSSQQRLTTWSTVLPSVLSHPLGHGIGTSGAAVNKIEGINAGANLAVGTTNIPDNYYVLVVSELGLPGLWLFLLLLSAMFVETKRSADRLTGEPSTFCEAVSVLVLAAMAAALFESYFEAFPMDLYFWLMVGVAAATWATNQPGSIANKQLGRG